MENRYKISYDIKQKKMVNISFMQGDVDTSVIEIQLFDNGQVVDITDETIEFRFLKPDNTIVAQDSTTGVNTISALEGTFECILMANTLAVPGVVRTEIVRKKNNFILTCPTFYFTVKSSIGNTILSSNYIASIENKMIEWQLNEDLRQEIFENNETNRQSIFETNEANRQEIFETNEADRENKMIEWQLNEDLRQEIFENNETNRQSIFETNEANRQEIFETNEEIRRTNEQNRQSNEVTRIENEDIRISQEESRVLAEESRESNETIRQQNEDERELNESNRVLAETDRVQAEITRQEGYNQAIDNFSTDSTQAINDFITETERVEAIYPTRLTNVENDLAQHKLDYASQFNEGFPSQAKDLKNNKTYTIKLQLSSEGNPQLISKEVI